MKPLAMFTTSKKRARRYSRAKMPSSISSAGPTAYLWTEEEQKWESRKK
jgi:hypothetical protein